MDLFLLNVENVQLVAPNHQHHQEESRRNAHVQEVKPDHRGTDDQDQEVLSEERMKGLITREEVDWQVGELLHPGIDLDHLLK